ncbi:MAG: DUF4180 domain-containing protein [Pseudomonadota bacterium]
MTDHRHMHGAKVLVCAPEGGPVRTDRDAMDLVALGLEQAADWVAVPVERLGDDFFVLSTRIAGEVIQKFVNYRTKLAVVGDISRHLANSTALRDFVYESNRGRHVWFVAGLDELEDRLASG